MANREDNHPRSRQTMVAELMLGHTMRHTVPVLELGTASSGRPCGGSGTLVRIRDRIFVATAAHVVENVRNEDIWVVPQGIGSEDRVKILGRGHRGSEDFRERLDLAWVEVDAQRALAQGLDPLGIDDVGGAWSSWNPLEITVAVGLPDDKVEADGKRLSGKCLCYLTRPYGVDEKGVGDPKLPPYSNPSVNQHLDQDSIFVEYTGPIRPQGMSGGGLWCTDVNLGRDVWHPSKSTLVGIIRSSNLVDGFVRGTRATRWLQMIAEDLPELTDDVGGRLSSLGIES